jgi:hypothetical protein
MEKGMSDISKIKRRGASPFPSIRKSADPFQPEMGEMDFAQDVEEFDSVYSSVVHEPEPAEQAQIHEENHQKQFRQRKKKKKSEEEEEEIKKKEEENEIHVDLTV